MIIYDHFDRKKNRSYILLISFELQFDFAMLYISDFVLLIYLRGRWGGDVFGEFATVSQSLGSLARGRRDTHGVVVVN